MFLVQTVMEGKNEKSGVFLVQSVMEGNEEEGSVFFVVCTGRE